MLDEASRSLFKALLALKQPISQTCAELEEMARQYGKEKKRIPPMQLKEWAGVLANRNPNKKINRWCYAIASEVLLRHKINPLTIAPPEKVAEYWALHYRRYYTLVEAEQAFITAFNPPEVLKTTIRQVIASVYTND